MAAAVDGLRAGRCVGVFPEGTCPAADTPRVLTLVEAREPSTPRTSAQLWRFWAGRSPRCSPAPTTSPGVHDHRTLSANSSGWPHGSGRPAPAVRFATFTALDPGGTRIGAARRRSVMSEVVAIQALPCDTSAPRLARAFVDRRLAGALDGRAGAGHRRGDAAIVVSELVTNAVQAAATVLRVSVACDRDSVRISVY